VTRDGESTPDGRPAEVVRHEEDLRVGTTNVEAGHGQIRKRADTHHVEQRASRSIEAFDHVDVAPALEGDSGEIETLADGSISIPVFEEQLVITKRLVVRERVIVQKRVTTEQQIVEADLRRERVEVEGDLESDDSPATPRRNRP
jgi:uncharacterized protein (TIGR02271 family)